MSKAPLKIYFDIYSKLLYNQAKSVTTKRSTLPSIVLTEKQLLNIQLVTDNTFTKYTQIPSGASADIVIDNDFLNPQLVRTFENGSGEWVASGSGTNEYYYNQTFSETPNEVYENAVPMTAGTVGTLTAGQWAYGDNDAIGENRVYVRLSDDTDPDTKASGYLTYKFADGSYTKNFVYSSDFNDTNSWWDEDTGSFRDPVAENGELTFSISANTDQFADRIAGDTNAVQTGIANTSAQVNIFEPGTADLFNQIRFLFLCRNRFLNDAQIQLDLQEANFYTKAEVDAIVGAYIPKVATPTVGNAVKVKADGTIEDAGFPASAGAGGDVTGAASSTDNAFARYNGVTGKVIQDAQTTEDDSGNVSIVGDVSAVDAQFNQAQVTDEAYAPSWDADETVPTKNAVYDEMENRVPKDLSGETLKGALDGSEALPIDDGSFKTTTVQTIVDKAKTEVEGEIVVEFGWDKSASLYGFQASNTYGTFLRTKTVADATVFALLHMDGNAGETLFTDDSTNAHTVVNEGSPVVGNDDVLWLKNSVADLSDGASGLDIPASGFDPQATEFGFTGKFYLADADKTDTMTFLHIGTGTTTKKVLWFYIDNGFLHYKIGTTAGSGDWTDQDSVEILTAGYLNVDGWNTPVIQRNGDELQVGINGYIVARLSMAGKTLNTPDVASRVRFGYGYEGSTESDFWTGKMDEVILYDGDKALTIATGGVTPTTYAEWSTEYFVDKKYDISDNTVLPVYVEVNASSTDQTATLPAISANNDQVIYTVYKYGANKCTIQPTGTDAVGDSGAGYGIETLDAGNAGVLLRADNTNKVWHLVHNVGRWAVEGAQISILFDDMFKRQSSTSSASYFKDKIANIMFQNATGVEVQQTTTFFSNLSIPTLQFSTGYTVTQPSDRFNMFSSLTEDNTLSLLLNADNATIGGVETILSHYEDASNGWYLQRLVDETIRLVVDSGGSPILSIVSTSTIADVLKHQIDIVKVDDDVALYIDGVHEANGTLSSADTFAGPFYAGQFGAGTNNFNGNVADLFIVNQNKYSVDPTSALSTTSVRDDYAKIVYN